MKDTARANDFSRGILTIAFGPHSNHSYSYILASRHQSNLICKDLERIEPNNIPPTRNFLSVGWEEGTWKRSETILDDEVPWSGSISRLYREKPSLPVRKINSPPYKIPLHERSLISSNSSQESRKNDDSICDSLRYFAEANDCLDGIDVICDINQLVDYKSTLLAVRDEFGASLASSLWLLEGYAQDEMHLKSSKIVPSTVHDFTWQLSVAELVESQIVDTIIPLNPPEVFVSNTRKAHQRYATTAAILDCEMSFRDSEIRTHDWISLITKQGRLPICTVEALYPEDDDFLTLEKNFWPYLYDLRKSSVQHRKVRNPFAKSLSPFINVAGMSKVFTNFLCLKGFYNDESQPDMPSRLNELCLDSSFIVSGCTVNPSPFYTPWNSDWISDGRDLSDLERGIFSHGYVEGIAVAVGTDNSIAECLIEEAHAWDRFVASSQSFRLDNLGVELSHSKCISESLFSIADQYR